ncbi:uncharacterized protein BDW43DRAFT_274117 [Aspergillus alliaceus]|uniref:uncharacterized protein n=1 Tax=Petromyces alliaceus TaxID=209559 RepID=UPI0012A5D7FF|nr:uncharacterized protein BDW43DRAFT_274117 [Aspergillus alliaceus]KAB8234418.1 hypothetical protein BDW43DRAFT_274117 [Aspergillus alliaceus]
MWERCEKYLLYVLYLLISTLNLVIGKVQRYSPVRQLQGYCQIACSIHSFPPKCHLRQVLVIHS